MNHLLSVWVKHHRRAVGGVLLAIAITACTAAQSQSSSTRTPVAASPAISPLATSSSPAISSPVPSPTPPSPVALAQTTGDAGSPQAAVQAIRDYYRAIALRNYQQAYSAWEGNGAASHQSFEQFQQGFANTACVAVEVGAPGRVDGAAGSTYIEVPVTVTAITTNGTPQRFRGSYVLRRVNNVSGSTPQQRQWHLYSANLTPVN